MTHSNKIGSPKFVITVILFVILSSIASYGQQPYDFTASTGAFTALTGATPVDIIEVDEGISGSLPIGFSFGFFGSSYTDFKASSNGFITFDLTETDSRFTNNLPNSFELRTIAPLWDDLNGSGGTASYELSGVAPNRIFTFEWLNYKWDYNASAAGISFQAKLYETTNKIEFVYRQETGGLVSPDASIGIIGNTISQFFALDNSSSSAQLAPNGFDLINTKPISNQVFAFTTPGITISTPTIQASSITPVPSGNGVSLSWTNGNGNQRIVLMKQTTTGSPTVSNNIFYKASAQFGNPETELGSSDWFCVYNGTGNSVNVTNLTSGLDYRIQIMEYNGLGGAQKYLTTTSATNPINATTPVVTPSSPSSKVEILRVSHDQLEFNIDKGDGTGVAVFMKANGTGSVPVVDGTPYTASTAFKNGSQVSTSDWYCVYKGTADVFGIIITGISSNTNYRIQAVDFNGGDFVEKYNVDPSNAQNLSSLVEGTTSFNLVASSGTFTPLVGATAIDQIESDDVLSSTINIGFTFKLGGVPFTQLKASSNGFITFNPYAVSSSSGNDLFSSTDRTIIAPLWDDLSGVGGQASYITMGTAPNRIFTIEWLNWKWGWTASTAGISFQLKLYETDNHLEFVYRQEAGSLSGAGASIGIAFPNKGALNHFSLKDVGANPLTSSTLEITNIAVKPANGQVYSFTPNKAPQAITFNPLSNKVFLDPSFDLTATASSGLEISYSSSNTSVAIVSGKTVTIVGVGMTLITASQDGNDSFNPALFANQTLTVGKANQIITFPSIETKTIGDPSLTLAATSTSGLPIVFSTTSTKVSMAGNQLTLNAAGSVTVEAAQAGNNNYFNAVPVSRVFCINPAKPTITVTGLNTENPLLTSSSETGHLWFLNGVEYNSGKSLLTTDPGVYTVKISIEGCSSTMSDPIALIITGDDDYSSSSIHVYPNPVSDEIIIELPSAEYVQASLIDISGKALQKISGSKKLTMNIENNVAGNYLLLIKTQKETIVKKIIKQ